MCKNERIKHHLETSAMSGAGVTELFDKLADIGYEVCQ